MFRPAVKLKIERELAVGETARREGNEGKARVCARRAAGEAVREYFAMRGIAANGPGAYDLLVRLETVPGIPDAARLAARRLVTRVDENYDLPGDLDLLEEARKLVGMLEAQE